MAMGDLHEEWTWVGADGAATASAAGSVAGRARPAPWPWTGARRVAVRAGAVPRRLGRAVLDLLYPPCCMACGGSVAEPRQLCGGCWRALPLIERPYCERLGIPFSVDHEAGLISPQALADPPVFGRARSVCRFDGIARELAHKLKYGDRLDLAPAMGAWMARAGAEILAECDLVIPVPLHGLRLWRRRMNQAALLADVVGRHAARPVRADILLRRRATRPQVRLSRAERAENLRAAFAVSPEGLADLQGRRVVLVDDVLTTGATANACARALFRGGAATVDVLTFAVVARSG